MKQTIWYVNKSLRLKDYDYSHPGAYFVTICIKNWQCLFGDVVNGKMVLNASGKLADTYLINLPNHFPETEIVKHIVMPNHVHAVVNLYDEEPVGRRHACGCQGHALDLQGERKNQKLFVIIGSYKSAVSKDIHKFYPSFKWQVSFHDHIIRTEKALANIYQYIEQNPENWNRDLENEKYLSKMTEKEREKRLKRFYNELAG